MSALLRQFTVLDHVDLVDVYDGRETMGAVDHSLSTHDVFQFRHNLLLGVWVKVRCSFVE